MDPFEAWWSVFLRPQRWAIGGWRISGTATPIISVIVITRVWIVVASRIGITIPDPAISPEPKVAAAYVLSMAPEPRKPALSTKVAPKTLVVSKAPEPPMFALSTKVAPKSLVASMAPEPPMPALSTRAVPNFLRPAQSPEFGAPVKIENSRARHP